MKPSDYAGIKESLEPPWDELREQRVLTRVVEEHRRRPALLASARARKALFVVPMIAAAAAAVFFFLRPNPTPNAPVASTVAPTVASPATSALGAVGPEQLMALADGSQAVLLREAGLQVEEQRSDRVRIHQRRGEVRYEVRPDPAREFTVRAGGTSIRVRGTVFTVDVKNDSLEVRVQRGKVEVDDGTRTRDLVAGESLRAPIREGEGDNPPPDPMAGADASVVEGATSAGTGSANPRSAAALQAHADSARLAGRHAEAATALERLVRTYPSDARVPAALFSLGRVERSRGQLEASARAFERCASAAPSGPLAADALAEAAASWLSAGSTRAAKAAASKYLARYPSGPSASKMRAIMGP